MLMTDCEDCRYILALLRITKAELTHTSNPVIHFPFYKDDIIKTLKGIEKSLTGHPTRFDKETITKLCALFTKLWLASVEAEAEEAKIKADISTIKQNVVI